MHAPTLRPPLYVHLSLPEQTAGEQLTEARSREANHLRHQQQVSSECVFLHNMYTLTPTAAEKQRVRRKTSHLTTRTNEH